MVRFSCLTLSGRQSLRVFLECGGGRRGVGDVDHVARLPAVEDAHILMSDLLAARTHRSLVHTPKEFAYRRPSGKSNTYAESNPTFGSTPQRNGMLDGMVV